MDRPKLLREPDALEKRLSQVNDSHVAPLTEFVQALRQRMGLKAAIPFIDPWDGGINAEVLFLLEAPGPRAKSSGFVSMNNPDETAKNFFEISREAGIDRRRTVTWNTVPWYIGSGGKIRAANSNDIASGIESLAELLELLPKLRAIVLVGGKAQKVESHIYKVAPHLRIFTSPHPSPMFVNRKPDNRAALLRSWQAVQSFLGHSEVG
jgi:uracil-DNA glycosylase